MVRFRKIVTHVRPHFDEVVAIWLLRLFGEEKFPGIAKAKVEYCGLGETPDGRSGDEYEKEGVLWIGVGGGRFDEHPTPTKPRTAGECTATLVAKALRVRQDPALDRILKATLDDDLRGGGHIFEVASILQLLHQQYPKEPDAVMDWAIRAIDAKYREQSEFFNQTRSEFMKEAELEVVPFQTSSGGTKSLRMITIVSDNELIGKFGRWEHGGQAAVVIQRKSSGNVMIFADKHQKPNLSIVAQMIRVDEIKRKGRRLPNDSTVLSSDALSSDGKVADAKEWFYQKNAETLLNGSSTAPDVPPTRIPFTRICEIVKRFAIFG